MEPGPIALNGQCALPQRQSHISNPQTTELLRSCQKTPRNQNAVRFSNKSCIFSALQYTLLARFAKAAETVRILSSGNFSRNYYEQRRAATGPAVDAVESSGRNPPPQISDRPHALARGST